MTRPLAIIALAAMLATACASNESVYLSTQADIYTTIDDIYDATLDRNPNAVYRKLSQEMKQQYSREEFAEYFERYYDVFLESVTRTRESVHARPFQLIALHEGDPCGYLSMTQRNDATWGFKDKPGQRALRTSDEHKKNFLQKIQTEQFLLLLNEYSQQHPEVDPQLFRSIRRQLPDIDENNIAFYGRNAVISFAETTVTMVCSQAGWYLVRCR